MSIPYYLLDKLQKLGINSIESLYNAGYLKVYKWLTQLYPALSHKVLLDLYCLVHYLPLNSLEGEIIKHIWHCYNNMLPTYVPLDMDSITTNLSYAAKQANLASQLGEVPIGAVIIKDNKLISAGFNLTRQSCDITAHAEVIAIKEAHRVLDNYRLLDCDLYVTIEPCLMCAGSIINSRIRRLVYGAYEPKVGAIVSQYNVFSNKRVNHYTEVIGPIDNQLYSAQIRDFFYRKRAKGKT